MTPEELLRELDQIEGLSDAANGARQAIARALQETAQRIPEAELPRLNDSLFEALGKIKGSSDAANWAREAIAWALGVTLLRQEGFKLGTSELKEIESALKGFLSLASEGNDAISLFPKYGDLNAVRQILSKEKSAELILAQIQYYHAQLLANYQKKKKKN